MSLKSYSSFSVKAFMIKVKQEKLFKHLDISLKVLKWGIFETKDVHNLIVLSTLKQLFLKWCLMQGVINVIKKDWGTVAYIRNWSWRNVSMADLRGEPCKRKTLY